VRGFAKAGYSEVGLEVDAAATEARGAGALVAAGAGDDPLATTALACDRAETLVEGAREFIEGFC